MENVLEGLSPNSSFNPRATQFTQDDSVHPHPFQFTQNTQNTPKGGNSPNSHSPPIKDDVSVEDNASASSSLILERALARRDTDTPDNKTVTQTVTPAASMPSAAKKARTSEHPDDLWKSFHTPADGKSFSMKKSPEKAKSSDSSDDDCVLIDDPVEIASLKLVAMSSNLCTGCGNRSAYCHERLYRFYCLKAVYSYFHNDMTNCHWASHFSGSSPSTVSGIYRYAYNDRCRGELDRCFGYFNLNWISIPECMEKGSFQEAMNLMNNKALQNQLKASNENGYKNYCEARDAKRA